jgi:hypothetical protein
VSAGRAVFIAPAAIFPVALVFVLVRSLMIGDIRELVVAPLSAGAITVVGYPLAVVVGWLLTLPSSKAKHRNLVVVLAVSAASAEAVFWILISPFWQRDFSVSFCVALVGICGVACGTAFMWLVRRPSGAQ